MKSLMLEHRDGNGPLTLAAAARGVERSPGLFGQVFDALLDDMRRDEIGLEQEMTYGMLAACAMLRDGGSSSIACLDRMIAAFEHVTKLGLLAYSELLISAVVESRCSTPESVRWLVGGGGGGENIGLATRVACGALRESNDVVFEATLDLAGAPCAEAVVGWTLRNYAGYLSSNTCHRRLRAVIRALGSIVPTYAGASGHVMKSCAIHLDVGEVVELAVAWGKLEFIAFCSGGQAAKLQALLDHPDFPWDGCKGPCTADMDSDCRAIFIERAVVKWAGNPTRLNKAVCDGYDDSAVVRLVDAGASIKIAIIASTAGGRPNCLIRMLLSRLDAAAPAGEERASSAAFFTTLLAAIFRRMNATRASGASSDNIEDLWRAVIGISGLDLNDPVVFARVARTSNDSSLGRDWRATAEHCEIAGGYNDLS